MHSNSAADSPKRAWRTPPGTPVVAEGPHHGWLSEVLGGPAFKLPWYRTQPSGWVSFASRKERRKMRKWLAILTVVAVLAGSFLAGCNPPAKDGGAAPAAAEEK